MVKISCYILKIAKNIPVGVGIINGGKEGQGSLFKKITFTLPVLSVHFFPSFMAGNTDSSPCGSGKKI